MVTVSKSRGTYMILAVLFGAFGLHNFYAGRPVSGAIKLFVLLVAIVADVSTGGYSAFSLVFFVIFALWALFEAFLIDTDGRGNALA